jgi:hypothetical protein
MKATGLSAAIAASLLATAPASAAECWSETALEAARIRQFETMMMVSTLRCRLTGTDFSESYNRFVREKRPVLVEAGETMRGQFAKAVGAQHALDAYDDFMTKIANGYGGGVEGANCADMGAVARAAADAPATHEAVARLALAAGAEPPLPGARCGISVALAK